jgi:hypothetical protein
VLCNAALGAPPTGSRYSAFRTAAVAVAVELSLQKLARGLAAETSSRIEEILR